MALITLATGNIFVLGGFPEVTRPDGLAIGVSQDTLSLSHLASAVSTNQSLSQNPGISQQTSVNKTLQISASNFFPIYSRGVRTKEGTLNQLLALTHLAKVVLPESISHVITFTHELLVHKGCKNTFTILQSVICNIVKLESVDSEITFNQGLVGLTIDWHNVGVERPSLISDYDPSQAQIPPIPASPYLITLIGGNNTLQFKKAEYGDKDSIEHTRISRRTIGNELIVSRDSIWPKTEILKFKLYDLSASQGRALLGFLNENLAKLIKLCDWNGIRWLGVITNPDTMLIQSGRDERCSGRFEIEIEFQGEQVGFTTNHYISNTLLLIQTESSFLVSDIFDREVVNTLILDGIALKIHIHVRGISSPFTINSNVSNYKISTRSVENTLTLSQNLIEFTVFEETVSQSITFVSSVNYDATLLLTATNTFIINQLTTSNQVFNRTTSNTITFVGTATTLQVFSLSASNSVTFVGNASQVQVYNRSTGDTLVISSNGTVMPIRNRSISNTITLTGNATAVLDSFILHESSGTILLEDATAILTE